MGRIHKKENTFTRAVDNLGSRICTMIELMKSILASQRDHRNHNIRANASMKYLVHTLGIENFRSLVRSNFGNKIRPWRLDGLVGDKSRDIDYIYLESSYSFATFPLYSLKRITLKWNALVETLETTLFSSYRIFMYN